jgi:putative ABC transport system permease protein
MDWHTRIRQAFVGSAHVPEDDVIEELAQHAGAVFDTARARGCSIAESEQRVDELIAQWKSEALTLRHRRKRAIAIPPPPTGAPSRLGGVVQDLRYALRLLRRQPRFAALVILTMALGIGTTTALFSVTYGVLIKPLPWPGADRLVLLKETRGSRPPRFGSFSNTAYFAWREQAQTIEEIAAWTPRQATLTGNNTPERIRAVNVTASLFRAIGARPIKGTLFTDNDEATPVVVVSESLWRQRLGADDSVIGRAIQFDGESRTIVGVLPDESGFPDRQIKAWFPFRVAPPNGNLLSMFEALAKLRPGVSIDQAVAEGTARGRFAANTGMTTMAIFGGDGPVGVTARTFADSLTAEVRRPLIVLLSAVGLLLLVAATNIASLQLARATARRRELAIRASIGASSARLMRQLTCESTLLGLIGGALGFGLAWLLLGAAPSILPADFPRVVDVTVTTPVVLFATLISLVTSVVFGLLPALRLRRLNLVTSLAEDGMSPAGGGGRTSVARARLLIVTGQIAVACVLLVGALLLGRSFMALLHADRGYDPATALTARVTLPASSYTPIRRSEVLGQMIGRLSNTPGVRAAAFSTELPLTPGGSTSAFTMPSRDAVGGTVTIQASPRIVSPQYFTALDLRILEGRSLAESDTLTSEPVVVVNDTFRRRYLPGGAVGGKLPMALWGQNQQGDATIVGVSEDVRYIGASSTSLAELYFSHRQLKVGVRPTIAWLILQSDGDQAALGSLLQAVVKDGDPSLLADSIMTLEDRLLRSSLARPRLYALLISSFAIVALVVTGVGLFGVLSYSVSQRTRELGVRAALGASRLDLVGLVVRQGAIVAAVGLIIGLVASVWVSRFIETLLYGVSTGDIATYVIVPLVLAAVVIVACIPPARRAAQLDPVKALRSS